MIILTLIAKDNMSLIDLYSPGVIFESSKEGKKKFCPRVLVIKSSFFLFNVYKRREIKFIIIIKLNHMYTGILSA